MTIFRDLMELADDTLDAMNAEPAVLHPQRRTPNGRSGPDPERQPLHFQGIFEIRPAPADVQIGDRKSTRGGNDLRLLVNGAITTLSIRERDLRSAKVQQGDRVDLPDRKTGMRFEIVSAQPDGHGRIILVLVER